MEKATSYETQLMGKPVDKRLRLSVKETYMCNVCEQVVIRHRDPASKPYVRWCCGNKMERISNKCGVCGKHIRGVNHFQGSHHLAAKAKLGVTDGK